MGRKIPNAKSIALSTVVVVNQPICCYCQTNVLLIVNHCCCCYQPTNILLIVNHCCCCCYQPNQFVVIVKPKCVVNFVNHLLLLLLSTIVVVRACVHGGFQFRPTNSLEILRGTSSGDSTGGYIEVRPGGVNKGAFVSAMLSRQV